MGEIVSLEAGINRIAEGGIQVIDFARSLARYNRISSIIEDLREGFDEEYLSMLSVEYIGPETKVDLTEYPSRQDYYPYLGEHPEDSTRTVIRAHWGDSGISKPFIIARQIKKNEGKDVDIADYRCDRPFFVNSLRLGQVLHVARVARGIQRRQRG